MKMRKCPVCKEYTLEDQCPSCNGPVKVVYPPKYSPEDKYGKYRRMINKQQESQK